MHTFRVRTVYRIAPLLLGYIVILLLLLLLHHAAVLYRAHALAALLVTSDRHAGNSPGVRSVVGRLAPPFQRSTSKIVPQTGRPAVLHLPEHGSLLLRELHRSRGESSPRRLCAYRSCCCSQKSRSVLFLTDFIPFTFFFFL